MYELQQYEQKEVKNHRSTCSGDSFYRYGAIGHRHPRLGCRDCLRESCEVGNYIHPCSPVHTNVQAKNISILPLEPISSQEASSANVSVQSFQVIEEGGNGPVKEPSSTACKIDPEQETMRHKNASVAMGNPGLEEFGRQVVKFDHDEKVRSVMEEEEVLMQALAEADEDEISDDGAVEIGSEDEYMG
ncbi:hypothetical protein B0H10DRAFT_1950555 [Mycena sp. CBHHK59/15]|nr:hypothetical protein B0H10DRAFT_1950555 [Mycena sp. CBHHK59/15]